jgi:uncharacterized protein
MGLDLHEIIDKSGGSVSFSCELDTERLNFPSVAAYRSPPRAEGTVTNNAGALTLRGRITAEMRCLCDRCATEYDCRKEISLEVPLAAELEDEDNPDIFLLDGDELDLRGLLETWFILGADSKFLCRPDCAGLCEACGANLNEGPCSCKAKTDPRLAVLEQLLDDMK